MTLNSALQVIAAQIRNRKIDRTGMPAINQELFLL
jgi:hypothetical protein